MSGVSNLHIYAQKLAGLKPDLDAPIFSPSQLHPDGVRGEHERQYFEALGRASFHFLLTRKKFKKKIGV